MIRLDDLGKTHINNNILTVGIEHISVSLDINEFAAIANGVAERSRR